MNKLRSIIVCSFIFFSIQVSWCQNYLYSYETPDVYNKDNCCKIGEEYIKSKFVPNRWKYERHSAAVYNFPNKNKLVVINYSVSYTEKQTLRSTNGNGFYTNNGWTNEVSKLKENKENVYHAVLIDSKGSPIKAIKVCNRFVLFIFKNSSFLMIASKENESDIIYTNVMCFNENGDDKWVVRPGDMIINDYDFWQDRLYVVGENKKYSYYRIIDLNSGSIVDEAKVSQNYTFTRIDIKSDGINLEEKHYNTFYYGKVCDEVKKYKANLSTKLLSGIQSAKNNEQTLQKYGKQTEITSKAPATKIRAYEESFELALKGNIKEQDFLYNNIADIVQYESLVEKIGESYEYQKDYSNNKWTFFLIWFGYLEGYKTAEWELSLRTYKLMNKWDFLEMSKGIKSLEELASRGDSEAMRKLGKIYLAHSVVKEYDKEKAIEWFTKAEELGNKGARYELIEIYRQGIFVKKNKKKAKELEAKFDSK